METQDLLDLSLTQLSDELKEDLNGRSLRNDITSESIIKKNLDIQCVISNRENIILCGILFIENFLQENYTLK